MEGLEYAVSLQDKMSGPAKEAAEGLSKLTASTVAAADSQLALASAHHKHGEALSELTGGFIRAVEPAEVLRHAFEGIGAGFSEFASSLKSGEVKGMIAGVTEAAAGLAQTLDLIVPGLGQVAAALVKVGGGFLAVTAGLIQEGVMLSIEATQAKQAMVGMFAALGGGIAVGKETEEMLSSLSEEIGITKDELAPLTKSFMAMGIEGTEALRKVTLAAASAQAIMGDPAAAHSFETLTKKIQVAVQTGQGLKIPAKGLGSLADMGVRVDDVAKRMNVSTATLAAQLKHGTVNAAAFGDALQEALIEKGAGPLARLGMGVSSLKKMFGQSIEDLFEDMGDAIAPVMKQVKSFLGIFSQSTPSGRAMKLGIGGAFTYVFGVLAKGILPIKHFFLDVGIWSLQTAILVKKNWSTIKPILTTVGVAIAFVAHNFSTLVHSAFNAVQSVIGFITKVRAVKDELMAFGTSLYDAGVAFVDGFVNGITSGIDRAEKAAKDLGAAAKHGVKHFLGIESPSRVMFSLGGHTSAGFSAGIRTGAPHVFRASAQLGRGAVQGAVSAPKASDFASAASTSHGGGSRSGGGKGVSVDGGIHITITAPNGVTDTTSLTETALALIFERLAIQSGVG